MRSGADKPDPVAGWRTYVRLWPFMRPYVRGLVVVLVVSVFSTVLGLTIDRGMIRSIDDPVRNYIKDGGYDSPHNSKITWRHHANQTSEWEGSMFGKSHDDAQLVGRLDLGIECREGRGRER